LDIVSYGRGKCSSVGQETSKALGFCMEQPSKG
jgi:hypothetical protein